MEQVDCDLEDFPREFNFAENETLIDLVNTEGIGSLKTLTCRRQTKAKGKVLIMKEFFLGGSE